MREWTGIDTVACCNDRQCRPQPETARAAWQSPKKEWRVWEVKLIWVTDRQLLVYDYHGSRLRLASKP